MKNRQMPCAPCAACLLLFLAAGCAGIEQDFRQEGEPAQESTPQEAVNGREVKTLPGGTKYIVHPSKIVGGGPPKDGIPSIDNPGFVSVGEADEWIDAGEYVFGLLYNGVEKAYPQQIMVWHEIVNDYAGDEPVLVTYCPLCQSTLAFKREINGEEAEFGTSGKLYNSNLVMYDRKTDSYWSQVEGIAIMGELSGMELEQIPLQVLEWEDWKEKHPGSSVLGRDTGYERPYGTDPYESYYATDSVIFPVESRDDTIHPKIIVLGIETGNTTRAYRELDLKELGAINDSIGGTNITLAIDDAGFVDVANHDTGEKLSWKRTYWFAWKAFHPGTSIYGNQER